MALTQTRPAPCLPRCPSSPLPLPRIPSPPAPCLAPHHPRHPPPLPPTSLQEYDAVVPPLLLLLADHAAGAALLFVLLLASLKSGVWGGGGLMAAWLLLHAALAWREGHHSLLASAASVYCVSGDDRWAGCRGLGLCALRIGPGLFLAGRCLFHLLQGPARPVGSWCDGDLCLSCYLGAFERARTHTHARMQTHANTRTHTRTRTHATHT